MTPREVDVAFVLEGVEGVREIYAIDTRAPNAPFDLAVAIAESGRAIAAAHYALLRVLSYDECRRVLFFHTQPPLAIAHRMRRLVLGDAERAAARARVPPAPAPGPIPTFPMGRGLALVVGMDDAVAARIRKEVSDTSIQVVTTSTVSDAVNFDTNNDVTLFVCARALAPKLFAALPERSARIAAVFGDEEGWSLRLRLIEVCTPKPLPPSTIPRPPRRLRTPAPAASLSVLLIDIDDDLHESLRRTFPISARHLERGNDKAAIEAAFEDAFHLVVMSGNAATHPKSTLDAIADEDPKGADGILIVAPARDVPSVGTKLQRKRRWNTVLALPLDDAALARELHRRHPHLTERVAVADVAKAPLGIPTRRNFRRLAVLVVDEDPTTHVFFDAGAFEGDADVTLAKTPLEAFEHVTSRPVDVLVISATMRSDGGEPMYRTLWRLSPDLKRHSFLVLANDTAPPSMSGRAVERPLDRARLERVLSTIRMA